MAYKRKSSKKNNQGTSRKDLWSDIHRLRKQITKLEEELDKHRIPQKSLEEFLAFTNDWFENQAKPEDFDPRYPEGRIQASRAWSRLMMDSPYAP